MAPWIGYAFILLAIYLNRSWWSITDNAISDLGNIYHPWVNCPWVLSTGLIIAGLGMSYFAYGLSKEFSGVARWGVFIFFTGMIFLTLIGVFPEGTPPHWYVSWAFFLIGSFGVLVTGIGLLLKYTRVIGAFSIALYILGWAVALWALNTFKGVAIAEFSGSLIMFVWTYVIIFWLWRGEKL